MKNTKYFEEIIGGYGEVRENLLKSGRWIRENDLIGCGGKNFAADRLLWIYDLFVQLSMLEIASVKEEITPEDLDAVKEFVVETGHASILDIINATFLKEYHDKSGNNEREFRWEDIEKADIGSVRRMIVALKRNFTPLYEEFSELYATATAASGEKNTDILKRFTMDILVAFASVDGEITLEEEDKTGDCFVVKVLNATARKLEGFIS